MLLVATCVGPSDIEGVGVFSETHIREGTRIWTFDPRVDRCYSRRDVKTAPAAFRELIERYAYFDTELDGYVLEGDHGRFVNHSLTPNVAFQRGGDGFALVDIRPGEELVCDYRDFEDSPVMLPSRYAALQRTHDEALPAVMRRRYAERVERHVFGE